MSDRNRIREQILGHLTLYRDLGVRWMRRPEPRKPSAPGRTGKRSAPAAYAGRPAPQGPTQRTILGIPMFGPELSEGETLEAIRAELNDCRRCKLAPSRQNIVFGSGNPRAELMFVGEAPGADEDEQGLPFVGKAGQLLTRIIEAMDMRRDEVYICNILKCRPPGNRNPEQDEIAACEAFLFRQIASVNPKVICALGAFGAQTLLRTSEPIGKLRGRLIDYRGAKMMATFHPAYLLRNPYEKRKVWEDLQIVRDYLKSLRVSDDPDH